MQSMFQAGLALQPAVGLKAGDSLFKETSSYAHEFG